MGTRARAGLELPEFTRGVGDPVPPWQGRALYARPQVDYR
jgi:hypothetical protein